MIKEITAKDFETEVLKEEKVLVDFNADWCGPCQMLRPILEELSEEREDLKIVSVNIDDNEELAEKYEVVSIPCLIVFKNGEEKKRDLGVMSKKKILKMMGEK
ncbi:thioredoxin [Candidatus Saccharibacteria bacterium]|nr:thioredoxin [Candidatus Saccharibacteria bacterium]